MNLNINMTEVANLSPEQLIVYSNNLTTKPALIILFIVSQLIFLLIGFAIVEKRDKLVKIWIISFLFTGVILLALMYLPNSVQYIVNLFN